MCSLKILLSALCKAKTGKTFYNIAKSMSQNKAWVQEMKSAPEFSRNTSNWKTQRLCTSWDSTDLVFFCLSCVERKTAPAPENGKTQCKKTCMIPCRNDVSKCYVSRPRCAIRRPRRRRNPRRSQWPPLIGRSCVMTYEKQTLKNAQRRFIPVPLRLIKRYEVLLLANLSSDTYFS